MGQTGPAHFGPQPEWAGPARFPAIPLIEVLMITNQGYLLLMVNNELSDRLKLIKHQIKILQAKDDNDVFDQALGNEVHSNQSAKIPK